LEDAKNYTFMTCGGVNIPGQDDGEEFQHTVEAMKVMGINDEDMGSIWSQSYKNLYSLLTLQSNKL
jgi:myosin heavy subunit